MASAHISLNGPYKRGNRWTAYAYCPERTPDQKHFTLRTSSKSVARQKLREIEGEIARGEWDPWEESRPKQGYGDPLGEAVTDYIADCERQRQAESTIATKTSRLGAIAEHVGPEVPVALVKTDDLRAWLQSITGHDGESRPSANTIRSYRQVAHAFFAWLLRRGEIKTNPASAIEVPAQPARTAKALRPYEVDRVRERVQATATGYEHYAPLVDFVAATGLRRGEVVSLPLAHCHLSGEGGGRLTIGPFERDGNAWKPKHGHERSVELFPRAAAILRRFAGERLAEVRRGKRDRYEPALAAPNGDALNYFQFGDQVSKAARKALRGREFTLHWLRHTHATWITNDMHWPLTVAQGQLGHEHVETTRGYVHSSQGSARAAMRRGLEAVGIEVSGPSGEDAREVGEWLAESDPPLPT